MLSAYAAVVVAKRRYRSVLICWPALALVALGIMSFARGALAYGIQPAGNGVRSVIYLALPLAALSITASDIRVTSVRLIVWLGGLALLFSLVAIGRWSGVVPMPEYEFVDDFREIERVLPADYPMLIGYALIGLLGWQIAHGIRIQYLLLAGIFAWVVLAVQHRSVWLATAAGLVWLFVRTLRYGFRRWSQLAGAVGATAIIGTFLLLSTGHLHSILSMLSSNIEETTRQDSTFAWRLAGFTEAVERTVSSGLVDLSIGPPSGRDLSATASAASIHIHNRYIDSFVFYGLAGGGLLIGCLSILASDLRRLRTSAGEDHGAVVSAVPEAILAALAVYFNANACGLLHGCLLGMLWSAACIHARIRSTTLDDHATGRIGIPA
jgi:hypothetical protein